MAILYGFGWVQQGTDDSDAHYLGYNTPRAGANALLFDLWNADTSSGRKWSVDLNGKMYSAALTAGDILYAVAGGVSSVKRLDSLAIGAANTVLTSSGTAPQWSTSLSLAGTLVFTGTSNPPAAGALGIGSTTDTLILGASQNVVVEIDNDDSGATGTFSIRHDAAGGGDSLFNVAEDGAVTVASGGSLVLTGTTVTGTPTWTSAQAITLSTASQPNITSLGTLTSLGVGAITSTGLIKTTLTSQQLALHYDASNHLAVTVASNGAVTYNATGAGAGHLFSDLVTANAGLTVASGQTLTVTGVTITGLTAASVGAGTFPSGAFVFQGAVSGITTLDCSGNLTVNSLTAIAASNGFIQLPSTGATGNAQIHDGYGNGLFMKYTAGTTTDDIGLDAGGSTMVHAQRVSGQFRLGFFAATPVAKPTVTGSRGGNAALASVLTELENLGLITDSSS